MQQRYLILIGICLGISVCSMAFSAINTALPVIKSYFSASIAQIQWVMNIFGITISSSLVIFGRLADIYGRKRIYLIGIFIFAVSILGSGLASHIGWIIVFQGLLGLATAILLPVSQALISNIFPPEERGKAIGIWAAVLGLAMAIGPLISGVIVAVLNWRWVFLINVPLILASLIIVAIYTPESRNEKQPPDIDWLGAIFLALTIGSFVLAVVQGGEWPSKIILALYIVSALALLILLYVEKKVPVPIIREDLFKARMFLTASIGNFCLIFFVWGCFFLIPLYLQTTHHFSTLQAGLIMLFVNLPLTFFSFTGGHLYARLGPKKLIIAGFIFLLLSAFIQMQFQATTSIFILASGAFCFGMGWGLIWGPTTTAAISTLSSEEAGIASGSFVTIQEIGGAMGLAITVAVVRLQSNFVTGYHHGMLLLAFICLIGLSATFFMKKTHAQIL